MNHYMRIGIGAVLDACDSADRHTGGVAAATVLALVIAAAAWWLLHAWNCWCGDCQPAEAAEPEGEPLSRRTWSGVELLKADGSPLIATTWVPFIKPLDEPDLSNSRIGTDDDALRACREIWNRTPRREETP